MYSDLLLKEHTNLDTQLFTEHAVNNCMSRLIYFMYGQIWEWPFPQGCILWYRTNRLHKNRHYNTFGSVG